MRLLHILIFLFLFFGLIAQRPTAHLNSFIQNKGQILNQDFKDNSDVLFLYSGKGLKIQLRKTGYSYEIFSADKIPVKKAGQLFFDPKDLANASIITSRVDIDFVNMNTHAEVVSEGLKNFKLKRVGEFSLYLMSK